MSAAAPPAAVDEAVLDAVRQHMHAAKVPGHYDRVYKDECAFSFDTAETATGLYINLSTWQAYGQDFVQLDQQRTGGRLYLHEHCTRHPLSEEELAARKEAKPTAMAIGGDAGFQVGQKDYTVVKHQALVLLPEGLRVPLPCLQLPQCILDAIQALNAKASASTEDSVQAWEEERPVSRHAEGLPQLPASRKISPDSKEWACDDTQVTENLWLNLSTGHIGSGRRNFDGSGGNGAALRHFEATGSQYPLVVKLGTITPHGADVYSYAPDENSSVVDPLLVDHLAHWGINMMQMEKTEKTTAELQIDLNLSYQFDRITESGADLKPLSGAGHVGLTNLGNSCYMSSLLQVLWGCVPELRTVYIDRADALFSTAADPPQTDFPAQMAKLGVGLLQARTGAPPESNECCVRPAMMKAVVGANHAEFSGGHQQDVLEYYQHFLDRLASAERAAAGRLGSPPPPPTSRMFEFKVQDRVQCSVSQAVSYNLNLTNVLGLTIPLEAATNQAEVQAYQDREQKRSRLQEESATDYIGGEGANGAPTLHVGEAEEPVLPEVPFAACMARFTETETLEGYYSRAAQRRTSAVRSSRLASFPRYLVVKMSRYYISDAWVPKKMEVSVPVPDTLSLEHLRGTGPRPEEQLQPDSDEGAAAEATPGAEATGGPPTADPAIVSHLAGMGFGENACARAALATSNGGIEAAVNWAVNHMGDDDFNAPLPDFAPAPPALGGGGGGAAATPAPHDPEKVSMLVSMGFEDRQAAAALTACQGDVEQAVDWLVSRTGRLTEAVAEVEAEAAAAAAAADSGGAAAEMDDGPGEYDLVAIISHMGANITCGHYVCHIKKAGKWVIYNDDKVAESKDPPRDLGYLYMFKRRE